MAYTQAADTGPCVLVAAGRSACESTPAYLPANGRDSLIARLNGAREINHAFGYGVGDDMDYLFAKYVKHSR